MASYTVKVPRTGSFRISPGKSGKGEVTPITEEEAKKAELKPGAKVFYRTSESSYVDVTPLTPEERAVVKEKPEEFSYLKETPHVQERASAEIAFRKKQIGEEEYENTLIATKRRQYSGEPAGRQVMHAAASQAVRTGVGIISFPEFLAEEVVGRVISKVTKDKWEPINFIQGPLSRESYGRKAEAYYGGGPSSLSNRILGGSEEENKFQEQNPLGTVVATGMDVFSIIGGGYATLSLKAGFVSKTGVVGRTAGKVGQKVSLAAQRASPKNLISWGYYKTGEKLGTHTYLAPEKEWHPSVLSGKTRFAEAPLKEQPALFQKTTTHVASKEGSLVGVHASPKYRLGKSWELAAGEHEGGGLSVSAAGKGSPHFLGIRDQPTVNYKYSLVPKGGASAPTAYYVRMESLYRLPRRVRTSTKGANLFMESQPKGKYGVIAQKAEMGGPEIEALISPGTKLRTATRGKGEKIYFTSYKGVLVRTKVMDITDTGVPTGMRKVAGRRATEILPGKGRVETVELTYPYSKSMRSILSRPSSSRSSSSISSMKSSPSKSYKGIDSAYSRSSRSSLSSSVISSRSSSKSSSSSLASYPSTPKSVRSILAIPSYGKQKAKYKIALGKKPRKRGYREREFQVKMLDIGDII